MRGKSRELEHKLGSDELVSPLSLGAALTRFQVTFLTCFCASVVFGVLFSPGPYRFYVACVMFGASCISAAWVVGEKKPLFDLAPALLLIVFGVLNAMADSGRGNPLLARPLHSGQPTFDLYTFYVDGSFGFQPSIWATDIVVNKLGLDRASQLCYQALPLVIGVACAAHLRDRRRMWRLVAMFILGGVLAVQCYKLLPVCGPEFLLGWDTFSGSNARQDFSSEQLQTLNLSLVNLDPFFRRNGMPSMHMAWAFMACCACWRFKRVRWFGLFFAILTAICTLTTGEHYLVDLAAAFPFTLALWAMFMDESPLGGPRRTLNLAMGTLGYLAWVLTIRFSPQAFWFSRVVPWGMLLVSVGGTVFAIFCGYRTLPIQPKETSVYPHSVGERCSTDHEG